MLTADDVAVDGHDNLYIADGSGDRVYRVDRDGIITTVAGTVSGKGWATAGRRRRLSSISRQPWRWIDAATC